VLTSVLKGVARPAMTAVFDKLYEASKTAGVPERDAAAALS
jgi:hypothetical protein